MTSLLRLLLPLLLTFGLGACSRFPRDPEKTSERVRGAQLRVGLVEQRPWVVRRGDEPAGAEVRLVRQFAQQIGPQIEWHWGGEQQQMEALEHFELDLLIGGLTKKTRWSKYVGLTAPYYRERIVVGAPPAQHAPESLRGLPVEVELGTRPAAKLERKGAIAVRANKLTGGALAAAPSWRLPELGLRPTSIELETEEHVIAFPPGENAWGRALDEFLQRQRGQVETLLREEEVER
jgi:polar amino acid transport system substrate-binding protein